MGQSLKPVREIDFWARVSFWLIAAGLVMGVLAAVLGLIDFLTIERARAYTVGWLHLGGNAAAFTGQVLIL